MSEIPRVTCEEMIAFLADYLSQALAAEKLAAFEHHLARCTSCVSYLETYRETIRMAKIAAAPDLADDLPAELVEAVRAAIGDERS